MCKLEYLLRLVYLSTYHLYMYLLGSMSLRNLGNGLNLNVIPEKQNIEEEFVELTLGFWDWFSN